MVALCTMISESTLAHSAASDNALQTAKSLLLANMSHELRTPLNAIIGFSQLIRDQAFGPQAVTRYADYAKDIANAGEQLLGVIESVLDMAKIESGEMKMTDDWICLDKLSRDVMNTLRSAADSKGVELRQLTPTEELPQVLADGNQLARIFANLLSNAIKFTPRGGEVSLRTEAKPGAGTVIFFADTGIGMSPEEVEAAMQPFVQIEQTLTKKESGVGLGLPIAKKLAEKHGASLRIESTKGAGTVVKLEWPAERVRSAVPVELVFADRRRTWPIVTSDEAGAQSKPIEASIIRAAHVMGARQAAA